jgi:gamma-butyrobetaine dioxygenase
MFAERLEVKQGALSIGWDDGSRDEYHFIWLRDHGYAGEDRHADTGERVIDFHEIPLDVHPKDCGLEEGDLRISWSDGKQTRHALAWLKRNAYTPGRALEPRLQARLWRSEMIERLPRFDYATVRRSPMVQLQFLRSLAVDGVALLEQAPRRVGELETLAAELGYLREICFGRLRELRVEPQPYNLAFTSSVVKPHTDLANYDWPPGVQFLHCLVQDAAGGDTRLVDGFAAAETLRGEDAEAFAALARVEVGFQIANKAYDVQAKAPVLTLGTDGQLKMIRFSNQGRRVVRCAPELVEPFYRGYHRLSRLLNDPANQIHFRLRPGDILAMNNHRVLHARDAFDSASGLRHLQIGSMELDVVRSRIRLLERQLNEPESQPCAT